MSKHTPGPWILGVHEWDVALEDDTHVAQANPEREEWTFNAMLISAAPDLLEACEAALEYMPSSTVQNWPPGFELKKNAIRKCRDAIAKARGQQ